MARAYLVGGDGDGQLFERDPSEHVPLLRPRGELLRGPGRWVYQATGRHVESEHGRCEVYQAHGQWVPYEQEDQQRDGDPAFTSLVAYRGSYGRGARSSGLGDVMIRLGELTSSSDGTLSIRRIA